MLEIRLLGPVEVSVGGRSIPLRHRERALLAFLALRAGETVSTDELVDSLWGPSPPKTVGAALHNAVSQARKAVGGDVLVTRAPGYALEIDAGQVDAPRFALALASARASADASERAEAVREALRLWRGRPLADLVEPFADAERSRLEELWLGAREDLVEAELARGRHVDVLADAEALVAEQPFSEKARALLMIALYRAGRQADALAAYQAARTFLRDELGLDPSPALRRLQAAMLRQDPALDPPDAEPALPVGEERRKTISVVFTDIVDSTALAAELDPEAYRSVLRRWYRAARAVLESHGGTVEKFIGDAVVGVYGIPRRHEDDAARAVRAAVELGERLTALNEELEDAHGLRIEIRTAVNTGEAVAGALDSPGSFATGYAVSVAAKLQQAAAPGAVLLGPATYGLVRDAVDATPLEPVALGSRGASLRPYRVNSIDRLAPGLARRLDAPLVGRTAELAALRAAFDGALCDECPRLVTVVGEAGIGKSRLAAELAASLRDEATVVVGRCVSYGQGATYLPVAEIVAQLAGSRSEARLAALLPGADDARVVARRLRQLLGWAEGAPPPGEGFWAVRRLLEARAAERALLVVLDDIHWAEPTLLDLVRHLVEHAAGAPLVVLCLARPDLVAERPEWAVTVALEPLTAEESTTLVERRAGGGLAPEARGRIVEIAEGNALFVEQLVAHVGERGAESLAVTPDSVESLLASRLDLLPETERAVLERAAVVGREFWRGAIERLSGRDVADELEHLGRKGLIRSGRSALAGEDAYRFHHVLIRDVAYAAATKERRSELHEATATWLDERDPALHEVIGYHLEQASRLRRELGRGAAADRLAELAGVRLADAGVRALQRAEPPAAVNLLDRAARLQADGPQRAETLCELGVALWASGQAERVGPTLREAAEVARAAGEHALEARAAVELVHAGLYGLGDLRATPDEVLRTAEPALALLEPDDHRALSRIWVAIGDAYSVRLDCARWGEAARAALGPYRASGYTPSICVSSIAAAAYWGAEPVDAAIERCTGLLAEVGDDRLSRASLSMMLGGLEGMRGRLDAAERLLESARRTFDEFGQRMVVAASWSGFRARHADLAGDPRGRERTLRESCEALAAIGQHADFVLSAADLADALVVRGALEEADAMLARAEQHVTAGDIFAEVLCAAVRAKLLAHTGEVEEAVALAERALALMEPTDALDLHARVLLDAASVRTLVSAPAQDSARLVERAVELYRRKGNTVMEKRARARLGRLVRA